MLAAAPDAASGRAASMGCMRERRIQQQIAESMRSGAARILDQSEILEPDDLVAAVVAAQQGDDAAALRVTHGMSQMVFRMAETNVRKWASHLPEHMSFDDAFAGGLEGLQKAVTRFEVERGYAFTTYASWWIRNGVQRVIYDAAGGGSIRAKALVSGVPADDPLAGDSMLSLDYGDHRVGYDIVGDPRQEFEAFDVDLVRAIFDLMSCVDPALPQIIDLLNREFAYREIARIVSMSAPKVRELHERGAAALRGSGLVDDLLELELV